MAKITENLENPECGGMGESVPLQTPAMGPVHIAEDRLPNTHRMLRAFQGSEPMMTQADATHLVCQLGGQFQNEAKRRSPQERTPLLQDVRVLMGRAQPDLGEEKEGSS